MAVPALAIQTGCGDAGDVSCAEPQGVVRDIEAKLYFEYQSTDNDTGLHGLFEAPGWSELCVFAPDGGQILAVKPQGQLEDLTMADLIFESREPKETEISQNAIVADFPEGDYTLIGTAFDGNGLRGKASLTHDIPQPPVITSPQDGSVVDPSNLVVTWDAVDKTVGGDPIDLTGYEVIVTNTVSEDADPHGLSAPVLSAHVVPSVTSLSIPVEFFEPSTKYELEVLALEKSGNQTITVVFFSTP